MTQSKTKYVLIVAVLAAMLGLNVTQADAGWGWRPWSPCYVSCYTPCYSVCYTPCCSFGCDPCCGDWYLGVRPGPIRRALFGRYRWYHGGWGYCSTCCWDPCCCSEVTVYDAPVAAPAEQPTPAPQPKPAAPKATPAPAGETGPTGALPRAGVTGAHVVQASFLNVNTRANSGLLTIYVPVEAKVTINGLETSSLGSQRRYVSHGLEPGFRYKYEVRAQIVRGEKLLEDVKTIYLTAGDNKGLAFGFNQASEALASSD